MTVYTPDPLERPDHPYAPLHVVWMLTDLGCDRRTALTLRREQAAAALAYYSGRRAWLDTVIRKAAQR